MSNHQRLCGTIWLSLAGTAPRCVHKPEAFGRERLHCEPDEQHVDAGSVRFYTVRAMASHNGVQLFGGNSWDGRLDDTTGMAESAFSHAVFLPPLTTTEFIFPNRTR